MKSRVLSLILIICVLVSCCGCFASYRSTDLTKDIEPNEWFVCCDIDEKFINSQIDFYTKLFKESVRNSDGNVLVSPLSVQLALAMTANGANGETKEQMQKILGGDISLEDLNSYLYVYSKFLPSDKKYKTEIANSIWFKDNADDITVEKDFLQNNVDFYGAQIYKAPFNNSTVKDINNWVSDNTDGMIEKIVDRINDSTVMYLINALVFDAEWESIYYDENVRDELFTSASGEKKEVEMMYSNESRYIKDDKATGFIKYYKDAKYSFAALLPNEDVDIYDYVDSLKADTLLDTLSNDENGIVMTGLPKFSYEYSLSMNETLKALGIQDAFDADKADFTGIGKSNIGNIYIGDVLHKTYISVDQQGTKAAAVTKVAMDARGSYVEPKKVILNRPFVYMIIDNSTNLPIFMGVVTDIGK